MNDHEPWTERAASYALGALDDPERVAFEAHLDECPRCREDLSAYGEAAHALALSAPPVTPPPHLRERILTSVRGDRPAAGVTPLPSRRWAAVPGGWAAAAAVAAIMAGGLWLNERRAREDVEAENAALFSDRARALTVLADATARAAQLDSIVTTLLGPDVRSTMLTSEGTPPSARLYWSPEQDRVILAAFDLPPAPSGRTYQLWGLREGRAFSLGTFDTGADGSAQAMFAVPADSLIDLGAITEEPAGGSPQPTTTPFLVGAFEATR